VSDDAGVEVVIRPISYADILQAPSAQELIDAYAAECSIPEIGTPCPQSDLYALLEASGALHTFGVYKSDELVGFAAVLTSVLPHYGQKVATLESIFVAHKHRDADVGRMLLMAVEEFAKEQDCEVVLYSAPLDSRFDRFLGYLPEYRQTNKVYCRRLN
jgi:GNAT superfamily N-acetyltransferase